MITDKLNKFFSYDDSMSDVIKHKNRIVWFKESGVWYKICSRCKIKKPDVEYYWKHDCINQRRGTCIDCCKDDNKKMWGKISNDPKLLKRHLNLQYESNKKKFEQNPELRIRESVRCSIVGYIKRANNKKSSVGLKSVQKQSNTIDIMGCKQDEFIEWMRAHLEDWMNWDNYGSEWVVGHVVPASWGESDWNKIKRLYHYKNLYPQCAIENGKLGAKVWAEKYGDWHRENLGDIVEEYTNKWKGRVVI